MYCGKSTTNDEPKIFHGYLTEVSFDAQRAVYTARNPGSPLYGLSMDQLRLYDIAEKLEREVHQSSRIMTFVSLLEFSILEAA